MRRLHGLNQARDGKLIALLQDLPLHYSKDPSQDVHQYVQQHRKKPFHTNN